MVIITPEAEDDIQQAYRWYESKRIGLGNDFELCVESAINTIERYPEIGECAYKSVRRYRLTRFPYGLYYVVQENQMYLVAVFHYKRSPHMLQQRTQYLSLIITFATYCQ